MNTVILAWVLVVSASTNQNSPVLSPVVADLASCERMQLAVIRDSRRSAQCVEVRILK